MRARQVLWVAGVPVRAVLVGAIRLYRVGLSGWLGGQCRYFPSCSRYAEQAIQTHGAFRGTAFALWRVGRCNPFGAGGFEPVPPRRRRAPYDDILRRGSVKA